METVEYKNNVPVIDDVDVLVCGGGPAGFSAAIASARQGARTMLVEQQGCLGGVGANALVGTWLGAYGRDGAYQVIGGVFAEVVQCLATEGAALSLADTHLEGGRHVAYAKWHKRVIPFDTEAYKRVAETLALEAGVHLRYFTSVVSPLTKGSRIEGVFLQSKSGMEFVRARCVVDATGDADIAYRAGCPIEVGREEDGLMSPASTIFIVEDVDSAAFESYCTQTGDVRLRTIIAEIKRHEPWPFPFEILICCETLTRGRFFINSLRQTGIDGRSPADLTRGMIEGRRQAHELFELMKRYVPGFESARLTQTSPVLGVRDTRRIVGDYRVSNEDIIEGRSYPDTIALSGYQWDMADPKRPSHQSMHGQATAKPYTEIPLRCLLPQGYNNLIVAGRCLSAAWQALGVLRIMPACMATGQAAGTAAALAVQNGTTLRGVHMDALQSRLRAQGAIISVAETAGGAQ